MRAVARIPSGPGRVKALPSTGRIHGSGRSSPPSSSSAVQARGGPYMFRLCEALHLGLTRLNYAELCIVGSTPRCARQPLEEPIPQRHGLLPNWPGPDSSGWSIPLQIAAGRIAAPAAKSPEERASTTSNAPLSAVRGRSGHLVDDMCRSPSDGRADIAKYQNPQGRIVSRYGVGCRTRTGVPEIMDSRLRGNDGRRHRRRVSRMPVPRGWAETRCDSRNGRCSCLCRIWIWTSGGVKEHAAAAAAMVTGEAGTRHGLVNLGGEIRIVAPPADGRWPAGLSRSVPLADDRRVRSTGRPGNVARVRRAGRGPRGGGCGVPSRPRTRPGRVFCKAVEAACAHGTTMSRRKLPIGIQ